jgi:hypothetical protein
MAILTKSDWRVSYAWSRSSGLRLGACRFGGLPVLRSASVPFVYVRYAGELAGPFTDELQSLKRRIVVRDIMHGFDLKVTYDAYGPDYEYDHVWRFHDDGQFGATIVIHGPGEELRGRHIYHLPFRFDLDISGAAGDSFQRRADSGMWRDVLREGRHVAKHAGRRFDWRVIDKSTDRHVNIRARIEDQAELWALAYKPEEDWGSWGGVQAATPGAAGSVPSIYASRQPTQNTNLVVWYLAHVSAANRVAACGPWFALGGYPAPRHSHDDHDHHHDAGHDHH